MIGLIKVDVGLLVREMETINQDFLRIFSVVCPTFCVVKNISKTYLRDVVSHVVHDAYLVRSLTPVSNPIEPTRPLRVAAMLGAISKSTRKCSGGHLMTAPMLSIVPFYLTCSNGKLVP